MFTKPLLSIPIILFGIFVFFDIIEYGTSGEICSDGEYCYYPTHCCSTGCCDSSDSKSVLETIYSALGVAVVFMMIFMCCKCCCNSRQRGVVYQPGVVNQTVPVGGFQAPPQQFGFQPPPQQYGYQPQQPIPPNAMYPPYVGMDAPYLQQSSVNPYYPVAPPPYSSGPTMGPTAPTT